MTSAKRPFDINDADEIARDGATPSSYSLGSSVMNISNLVEDYTPRSGSFPALGESQSSAPDFDWRCANNYGPRLHVST